MLSRHPLTDLKLMNILQAAFHSCIRNVWCLSNLSVLIYFLPGFMILGFVTMFKTGGLLIST